MYNTYIYLLICEQFINLIFKNMLHVFFLVFFIQEKYPKQKSFSLKI